MAPNPNGAINIVMAKYSDPIIAFNTHCFVFIKFPPSFYIVGWRLRTTVAKDNENKFSMLPLNFQYKKVAEYSRLHQTKPHRKKYHNTCHERAATFLQNLKIKKVKPITRGNPVKSSIFTFTPEKTDKWFEEQLGDEEIQPVPMHDWVKDEK